MAHCEGELGKQVMELQSMYEFSVELLGASLSGKFFEKIGTN